MNMALTRIYVPNKERKSKSKVRGGYNKHLFATNMCVQNTMIKPENVVAFLEEKKEDAEYETKKRMKQKKWKISECERKKNV